MPPREMDVDMDVLCLQVYNLFVKKLNNTRPPTYHTHKQTPQTSITAQIAGPDPDLKSDRCILDLKSERLWRSARAP